MNKPRYCFFFLLDRIQFRIRNSLDKNRSTTKNNFYHFVCVSRYNILARNWYWHQNKKKYDDLTSHCIHLFISSTHVKINYLSAPQRHVPIINICVYSSSSALLETLQSSISLTAWKQSISVISCLWRCKISISLRNIRHF